MSPFFYRFFQMRASLKSVCGILFTEYPGFCFVLFKGSFKSTEISLALIFLISKLFGLLSGMKLKEFFLLQNSRSKRKTLRGSFDFRCRFGLSVLARNEPEAPIKRQHHTEFFIYIYSTYKAKFIFPRSKYKMDSLFHSK